MYWTTKCEYRESMCTRFHASKVRLTDAKVAEYSILIKLLIGLTFATVVATLTLNINLKLLIRTLLTHPFVTALHYKMIS